MMNSGRRIALAGLASIAGVGATIGRSLRDSAASVVGIAPKAVNHDGMPLHDRTPRTSGKAISVAQGKRNATKAKNRARNRLAHKGARK